MSCHTSAEPPNGKTVYRLLLSLLLQIDYSCRAHSQMFHLSSHFLIVGPTENKTICTENRRRSRRSFKIKAVLSPPDLATVSGFPGTDLPSPAQPIQRQRRPWLFDSPKVLLSSLPLSLRFELPFRNAQAPSARQAEARLLQDTTDRAVNAGKKQNAEQASKAKDVKSPPLNIGHYLHKIGIMEIRYMRMLASLCNLTYYMRKAVSERSLYRRHGLQLVTTSLVFEKMVRDPPRTPFNAAEEADGMAAGGNTVATFYNDLSKEKNTPKEMKAIDKLKDNDRLSKMPTPAEVVGARLLAAYDALSSAAAPLASNISNATSAAVGMTKIPLQALASQLQSAAAVGQSTALATVATVTAAFDSAWGQKHVTTKQAVSSSYWFVADDPKAKTRFFVIQGSNNIDHWKINLQFDPVTFEEEALGLKVHRGFYEAAKILYEQFLPLVEEHLASNPFAKIVFTGHSLGGSVSSLLMLMFYHRKVIPNHALGPVYTFGAPAIFCETHPTEAGKPKVHRPATSQFGLSASSKIGAVLQRMGLNSGAIRNIMMHRDIVPRAFACDYALVADLLPMVSESFRNLESLRNPERQVMYHQLGRILILQPDEEHNFVCGEADHPMLPPGPNLFALRERHHLDHRLLKKAKLNKEPRAKTADHASSILDELSAEDHQDSFRGEQEEGATPRRTGEANLDSQGSNIDDSGPDRSGGAHLGPKARTVNEALATLMDTPHPLDILGEPGSYGFSGAISRYHDPDHYCKALGGVLRARNQPYRNQPSSSSISASDQIPKVSNISAIRTTRQVRNKDKVKPMLQLLESQYYSDE